MINRDVFGQWFDKEVQARWKTLNLSWIELGIWEIFTNTHHGEMLLQSSRLRTAQH